MTAIPWIAWSVVVPLAGATVALVAGARAARWVGLATAPVAALASAALAVQVRSGGAQRHLVGGWGAPLGIDLHADGLSALMLLMTAAVGLGVTVHAFAYFEQQGGAPPEAGPLRRYLFWPLWLFLWGALAALFLTRDVFNAYVTLELVSLSAVALVALAARRDPLVAAANYLVLSILAALAYLLGVGLLYAAHGTLEMDGLRAALGPGLVASSAIALVSAGLCLKAALFPLHVWLPPAHAGAPAPASAVLSALVVKAAFYLLVRWLGEIVPGEVLPARVLLGILGSAAIAWGSIQALRQDRLKQVLAYSTVAQIGYLFLFFPLATGGGRADALQGIALFAVAHALAKAALFLAAGGVLHALASDRLDALRGLGRRMPLTTAALVIASSSLLALPPSGGFCAKWLLITAALRGGAWWWVVVMVGGGLLTAAYWFRVLEQVIAPPEREEARAPSPAPMQLAALALAVAALGVGLVPWAPLEVLGPAAALAGVAR